MKFVFLLIATLAFGDKYDQFLGREPVREAILLACAETGIPIHIAAGLQWSEWRPGEPEVGTSRGWWQLNTKFHAYYRDKYNFGREFDEYDPVASTFVALRYLADLYRARGVFWRALVDYKHGPNAKTAAPDGIMKLCKAIAEGRLE